MYPVLKGLRIVEGASFIAAPSCGLYLSQLGAEVIRFDMIGGGPDFGRWPKAQSGHSLYWEGLNKGKKSIAIDLARPEGRELAIRLITAPGPDRGIFLTNYPATGFLAYERLAQRRSDLIVVRVMGRPNGGTELDYTVNSAVGMPLMTGPASLGSEPVNHVLPAWDLMTGAYAAFALVAAERHRQASGQGQEVRVPLSDIAMTTLGNLGQIAEVTVSGADRPRFGNDLFGAFGRDFVTRDGKRIMIVALTARQWAGLIDALHLGVEIDALQRELGVSFAEDEGVRFEHRDRLNPLIEKAIAARDVSELQNTFGSAVCWSPYRTLREALAADPDFSTSNPVFSMVTHASGHAYLTPGSAASFTGLSREDARPAPSRLGAHTDEVLATYLGLSATEIGRLHDQGLVK